MEKNSALGDIIDQFISRFRREYDFYEQAGRIVAQRLDAKLESSGIRAMVTSRAKNPKRLEVKIRQRNSDRDYKSVEEIYNDIVDLAGVRIALYFPGERDEVDKIIKESFRLTEVPKIFTGTSTPKDKKRFSGYWATHYRLQLPVDTLPEQSERFTDARIEVQVASVLMHAWSEVEHDLVYKPMQGILSEDELAILDELNGMVLTGEIALERLQRAGKVRVSATGAKFDNHYNLASYLFDFGKSRMESSEKEPVVGDVETLFRLLNSLNIFTPDALQPYLQDLTATDEQRPLAQQIIDQIVATQPERYAAYATIRAESNKEVYVDSVEALPHNAIEYFIEQWIVFERFLKEIAFVRGYQKNTILVPNQKLLKNLNIFSVEEIEEIERIRQIRNGLVHGFHSRQAATLLSEGYTLSKIISRLKEDQDNEIVLAIGRALAEDTNIEGLYDKIYLSGAKHSRFELSKDSIDLLRAAAKDELGQILKLSFLSGRMIQAGGNQYGNNSAKEFSRWDAALNELLAEKLVEVHGHKGEIFMLTNAGWKMAENLEGTNDS